MSDIIEHEITIHKNWLGKYHVIITQPIGFFMDTREHIDLILQYAREMKLITEWIKGNAPKSKIKKLKSGSYVGSGHGYNQLHIDFKLKLSKANAVAFKLEFC